MQAADSVWNGTHEPVPDSAALFYPVHKSRALYHPTMQKNPTHQFPILSDPPNVLLFARPADACWTYTLQPADCDQTVYIF